MSAFVESMAYKGEVPWHSLGNQVTGDMTPEEMAVVAGIDWTVSKRPLMAAGGFDKDGNADFENMIRVKDQFAITRDSDNRVLSLAGRNYKPVQNLEAMDFFKRFTDAGHMELETAGSLKDGQFIWALAKIGEKFNVGKKKDDIIEGYLLLMSPHLFGYSLVAQFTPIRVVCWNTLNLALGSSLRGKGDKTFRMPHSKAFNDTTKAQAEEALGIARSQFDEFAEAATHLSSIKMNDEQVRNYFFDVLTISEEKRVEAINDGRMPANLQKFEDALIKGPGAKLASAKGTLWGALNAVTYVADHEMGRTRDIGLSNAWLGDSSRMKRKALDLAVKLAA